MHCLLPHRAVSGHVAVAVVCVTLAALVAPAHADEPTAASSGAATRDPDANASPPENKGPGTQKVIGFVAVAAGLVGVAVGSQFGLLTLAEKAEQQADCPSALSCRSYARAASAHANGITYGMISTAGFVAGGALLVTGIVLVATAGKAPETPAKPGIFVVPSLGPTGAGIVVRGEF
jgi:hypothetical protein